MNTFDWLVFLTTFVLGPLAAIAFARRELRQKHEPADNSATSSISEDAGNRTQYWSSLLWEAPDVEQRAHPFQQSKFSRKLFEIDRPEHLVRRYALSIPLARQTETPLAEEEETSGPPSSGKASGSPAFLGSSQPRLY